MECREYHFPGMIPDRHPGSLYCLAVALSTNGRLSDVHEVNLPTERHKIDGFILCLLSVAGDFPEHFVAPVVERD